VIQIVVGDGCDVLLGSKALIMRGAVENIGLLSASIKVAILPKSLESGPWTQGVGVDFEGWDPVDGWFVIDID
jgi:hypothetical protein